MSTSWRKFLLATWFTAPPEKYISKKNDGYKIIFKIYAKNKDIVIASDFESNVQWPLLNFLSNLHLLLLHCPEMAGWGRWVWLVDCLQDHCCFPHSAMLRPVLCCPPLARGDHTLMWELIICVSVGIIPGRPVNAAPVISPRIPL